jgi:hypothetical protein
MDMTQVVDVGHEIVVAVLAEGLEESGFADPAFFRDEKRQMTLMFVSKTLNQASELLGGAILKRGKLGLKEKDKNRHTERPQNECRFFEIAIQGHSTRARGCLVDCERQVPALVPTLRVSRASKVSTPNAWTRKYGDMFRPIHNINSWPLSSERAR